MAPYHLPIMDPKWNIPIFSVFVSLLTLITVILSIVICACCKRRDDKEKEKEVVQEKRYECHIPVCGVGKRYQHVTSSFTIDCFRSINAPTTIGARSPGFVFSPYALQISLAVCMLGGQKRTQTELVNVVFPHSGTSTCAEDILKQMTKSTEKCRKENAFRVLTRIYAHSLIKYGAEFRAVVNENYRNSNPFVTIDYRKAADMATTTNKWLTRITGKQLTQFTTTSWRPIDPLKSSLCVVSAATMSNEWTHPFYRHRTRSAPFFVQVGKSINVDMMRQMNVFGYYQNEQMQVLQLEYTKCDLALYVFLPRSVEGLGQLEKKLSLDILLVSCDAAAKRKLLIEVLLPRFTMESELDNSLIVALTSMGLATAFKKGEADFSHMLHPSVRDPKSLWISGIVHKAMIEFTDVSVQRSMSPMPGESQLRSISASEATKSLPSANGDSIGSEGRPGVAAFVADHPFLFLIVEHPNSTPLFMGRYCGK